MARVLARVPFHRNGTSRPVDRTAHAPAWWVALVCFGLMAGSAHATLVDWRDNAANGNWDNGDCAEIGEPASQWWYDGWSPNRARNEPDCFGYRHLRFNNNHQTTMTLNGRWYDANAVNFGSGATTARTMGSNGLDLRSANNGITNNSTANHTWNSSIAFNATPIHFRLNSGNLTFNGSIFFKANFLEVWGDGWHTLNLNGVLNRDGGDGGLAVKANTLVIVTNNNTITGDMWAEKGTIRLGGNTNAMGNGRSISVGTNAIVELSYSGGEILRTNTWFVYGTGTNGSGAIRKTSGSGNVTIPGRIVVNQDTVIRSDGGSLIVSNVISGTPVITKLGSGTLELASNNTYSGKTHISNGVVVITANDGLGTSAGDTTVISGGALEVRGVTSGEPLVLNGHGVSGTGAVYNDLTTAAATLSAGVTLNADSAIGGAGQLTLSGAIGGSGQFTKTGSGTNIVSGNNTFTGVAIVSNGILRVTHTNGLGTTAGGTFVRSGGAVEWAVSSGFPAENFTLAGSGVTNGGALRHTATGTSTLRGNINLDDHATFSSSAGTLNLAGFLNLSNRTLTLDHSSSISMASGSSISNATLTTGSGAIVKNGTGIFTLRPSSDLTGSITVNGGELRIGPNASGSGLVAGGTLTLNDGTKLSSDGSAGRTIAKNVVIGGNIGLAENSGGNLSFSGTVDLGGSVRIITNSASVGFMGVVSGTGGGITKRGSGTLTNGVASTYTGATTIEEGTLYLSGSLLNSAVTISTGGTLRSNSGTGFGDLTVRGLADPGGNGTNLVSSILAISLNLGQNGKMIFDINNVTGSPGSQWDRFLVNSGGGTITIGATSGNKFTIRVTGNPTGWDNTQSYSWMFADGGTMVSFASDRFAVEVDSSFPSLGGGTFAVTNSGGDLFLSFTPAGGPDIEARGNGAAIVSGDTTPSLTDHTDFGDVLTTGGTLTRTYTFTNAGVASVGLGNISFSGGNAGDFTVVNQLPDSLAAGGTTNIQITFDPSADGTRSTTLTFTNTVTGKTPYTFTIQGTGVTRNIDVRGNGNTIADGDTTPSTSDHTDFGSVGITGDSLVRTYTITNTGNREVGLGTVSISGTHAADYSVTTQPPDSLAAGGTTTFQVTFDPSAGGLRSASLSFTNTTSTGKSPYNFDIQGTGAGSGISNFPTTLAFSSVLGSLPSPSFQAFGITNVGLGTMTYSLTTNANWLRLSNNTFTAAAGAGNVHTAHVQLVTGIAAGTSNATITITGDANTTNSPKTISVTWTISAIPSPSAVSVQGDGPEFTRLFWTKDASYDVMIVHRATNAPSVPANNTAYNVGDAVGSDGSRVIYKGAAANFEHVVVPGTTNHYAFYSINNNFYSPGVAGSSANPVYAGNVIVESFAYTNAQTMASKSGGFGWTNNWSVVPTYNDYTVITQQFTAISGHPGQSGNSITGSAARIIREFNAVTNGKLFAMYMMRTDNGGGSQFAGLSFFNNDTEIKFFGEGFSQVNQLTVGSASGRALANNTDYTIIAMFDFAAGQARAVLYTNATESIPAIEPVSWHVSEAGSATRINRIRLASNVGARWDEVRIATNYYDLLGIQPPGPGLSVGPSNQTVTLMKGNSAEVTFGVTNNGGADLIYTNYITYGTGSGWLSVAPSSATVVGGDTRLNTGTVSAVGLSAGTYYATNRVDGNQTNAASFISFDVTVTNIPAPTSVSAVGDGPEMVRIYSTAPSGLNVLIVHRDGQAPSADPVDNTPYALGATIGGGTVIYVGGNAMHEQVVAAGSTNFYRLYSINNDHYSPMVAASVTTITYRVGEIVENFSYTNNATLGSSHSGGQGWSGAWSIGSGTWIVKTNGGPVNFTDKPNYPNNAANRIRLNNPGNGNSAAATRNFAAPVTNGTIYVAAHMAFEFQGADKWQGINFLSNGNVRAFFGEVGHDDKRLGLSSFGSSNVTASYNFNDFATSTNNTYLVVGAYNFDTRELKVAAFYRTTTVPTSEPTTWDAYGTVPANYINSIDGIRLSAGSSGSGTLGDAYYDEVRVATTWAGLLGLSQPSATSYAINQGTNVTDGQIVSGAFTVRYDFYDSAGMSNSASIPNFDLVNPSNVVILTNQVFANVTYSDAGRVQRASNTTHTGASGSAVVLGVYTSRWTAINSNGVTITDSTTLSNGTVNTFTVIDDDTGFPVVSGLRFAGGTSLTDGQLFAGGWSFTGLVQDTGSGIDADGTPGSDPFPPHFDILNPTGTEAINNATFTTTPSDGAGLASAAPLARSAAAIAAGDISLGTWTARVYVADNDNDRTDDRLTTIEHQAFTVTDDDTTGPVHSGFTGRGRTLSGGTYTNTELGSGLVVTGLVTDAQSGVYGGTSNRWTLFRNNASINSGAFTALFADGTAVSSNGQLTVTIASGDVSASGSYTLRVFSVNYDIDRAGDSESTSTDIEFTVVAALEDLDLFGNNVLIPDGDTTPTLADHTDFGDVLIDGGTLTRTYTITNSGAAVLGIGNVTTNAGGNPTNFIVTVQPAASLAIGATTTFQVQFNPSTSGTAFADIQFTSTVASAKNPYTFRVQGTGTFVEIAVTVSGVSIADGSASPSTANGTDFGSVGVNGATSNITYTITNSGNRAMSLGTVTTSGTHAADFIVTAQPASTLNPSNTTTFTVQFNPSAAGLRSAALSFSTTDDAFEDGLTENPFNFSIQGTGAGSGISNFPTTLAFSSVLGSLPSPSFQAFAVTNVGLGSMTYTLATNANWLRLSNNTFTAAAGAGNVHTAHVQLVSGISPGTSNATITITGDSATTNSPKTVSVSWTISAIPAPSAQTATPDGRELVRLAWTKDAGYNVMIIHRQTNAPTVPTNGTTYSAGYTFGDGSRVILYNSGAASLDHVVQPGSENLYAFYSINNDHYSAVVSAGATTLVYQTGELVEQFGYTNSVGLQGLGGGQGWTNAWTISVPRTNTDAVINSGNFSTFQPFWPTENGNRLLLATTSSVTYAAFRGFPSVSTGSIYVAALYRRQFNEGADGKFSGISFMNGSTEIAFVGEPGGSGNDDRFGVDAGGSPVTSGGNDSFPAGVDRLIIGRYDFASGTMNGIFYNSGDAVPSTEPSFTVSVSGTPAAQITGIRLASGASSGWNGETYFDEVRVAQSWADLLRLTRPVASSYAINGGSNVTDAQVASGAYPFVFTFYDSAGISNTASLPSFDIWNSAGTRILTNQAFANNTFSDAGRVLLSSNATHAGAVAASVTLGTYTSRWTAANSNGVLTSNSDSLSNGTKTVFTVVDDDTTPPVIGTFIGQGRALSGAVYTNNEFTGGFWVTGTVTDAFSGLFANSNTFVLTRDGSAVSSGVFAVNFANGGATAGGLVSNNFPLATMVAGAYTLTVFAVDYDIDRTDDSLRSTNVISFSVVEPPSAPGLAVGPLTLSYTAMLGSNPDVLSTFNVTNVGSAGTLIYTNFQTYGTGATGWFAANPTNNSLGITGVRIHTGHVASATFTATGTYTATNRVAGNQTNAAQEIVVTLVVTAIPPPTVVSATPSGAEFVRVDVTEPSGRQILIVSRQTNAPSADPTQGIAYNLGDTLGGGRVVYKGSASFFEQVVQPGSTNFYNVYTINNDRYSAVTTVGATTTVYGAGVIIEPFSYTNNASLSGVNGGIGWTNAWTVSSGGYGFSTSLFSAITGYPADAGNVVTGTSSSAYREFAEYTSGKLYVSYKFRVSNGSGYAGLSFFNNGVEQIFYGERGGATNVNMFAVDGGSLNVQNGGTLANDTDYTIIGMYDFDNDIARGWIFTNATQSIPSVEPAAHAQITDADPTRINRVRLESGSGTVVTRWDEIRIATTWDALLQAPPTYIWDAGGGADRNWNTAANWTADTEPAFSNNAFIGNSYTGVVATAGRAAASLFIGHSGTTGTLLQTGGSLSVSNLILGQSNNSVAVFSMSGGTLTSSVNMIVGAAGASTAIVNGVASRIDVAGNIHIGMSNANNRAVFLQNAGTVTVATVSIGELTATEGRYTMTGGVLSVGTQIYMGNGNVNSTGRFEVTGGRVDTPTIRVGRNGLGLMTVGGAATVSVNGGTADIIVGDLSNSTRTNTLFVNGGTVSVGRSVRLGTATGGNPSFGAMYMSGGSVIATSQLIVADTANSTGIVSITGGDFLANSSIIIGNNAPGVMAVHGGTVTGSIIRLSDNAGGAGSTLLVGGGRVVASGTSDFEIDFSGTATVTGGVLEAHDIDLGTQAGALAALNIGGNGTVIANNPFVVGFASGATGVVTQTGGTLDLVSGTASFNIGATAGSFGFYTVTGGVITTDHNLLLGSSDGTGTGVFHVVGSAPSITIGDGTTEDFTMQSAAAELRVTFVNSGLAPILVQDDITVAGTLTISNEGPWAAGTYTVVTSLNSSAVIGTFASINWLGGVTGTVTYTDRAVRITVDGNIPNPTNQTAVADGKEMVRLAWTQTYTNVMIVHRAGAAVSGDPVQGAPYNVGDSLGGGTVIYKGSATSLEHIVGQGTTHHYEFFSYSGNFYSTGVTASATTEVYGAGELVEQFAYTNAVAVSGLNGGQGWTNAWTTSAPNAPVDVVIDSGNFSAFQPQWPDEKANRLVIKTTNSTTYSASRGMAEVTSGQLYVAVLYRRQFNEGAGDNKRSGVSLMSGSTEVGFFGHRGGGDDQFGASTPSGGSLFGAANSFPAANEHLLIGRFDFNTKTLMAIYYDSATSVPSIEPTYFAGATNASATRIDGIRLSASADIGWNGEVHFDELRVATSWADLLRLTGGPYATNYVIGNATNYVFDGQIRDGTYTVALDLRSGAGIETVNTTPPYFIPNYDILSPLGVQVITDRQFNAFTYIDGGLTVRASNNTQSVVGFADTVLGTYTGRWSAISSNGLTSINNPALSNGTAITFTVVDDDTAAPTVMAIHSPEFTSSTRFMQLSSNNTAVGSVGGTSSTNITFRLTDHYLANHVSNATPLVFYFGARDAGSGLSRGTTDAESQSFLTIGSAIVSNVFNWDTTRSSGFSDTTNTSATSVWSWVGAMLPGEIDNLVTNAASGVVGSNRVTITWRDADNDRANDRDSLLDQQHGWLVVTDDDTLPPLITNFAIRGTEGVHTASVVELLSGSFWSITGRVVDGSSQGNSGINVNGTNTVQPNSSPYFELWDPNGVMQLRQAFNNVPFGNGGATTLTVIGSSNNNPVASAITGTWTARVIVADADNDRTSDRSIATNEFTFEVVAGASLAGMQVNTSVLNITSLYGTVSGSGTWPNFTVTNNGVGPLIYNASITYNGGSGWLTVNPNTSVTLNDGQSQIHTAAVNVASLNPGTYQAVVALAGNQTNGTRFVTNNLTVIGYFVNEIVDPFTNTAGTALNGLTGGTGWTNAWNSSTFTLTMTNLAVPNNYPAAVSNRICGSTASEITARRHFPAVSTGKLFAAVAMRKDANDNNGYAGISFMEGSTERVFAGKIFNSQWLGIDFGGSSTESGFGIYQSTYLIVLYYDFDNDVIRTRAFNPGDTLSLTEPNTWSLVRSNAAIASIDGIRLAGSAVGNLCFDEVRVARTWETLLNQFSSEPTLHASAMTFANITTSSMTVGWTPGNGAARIVIAREGSAVTFTPVDGSNYTANADFSAGTDLGGGQKVIYNGSGTSVDFVSLNSETQYFFRVFEYNGSSGSTDYLTSGTPLNGSRWTLKIEPSEDVINFNAFTGGDTTITNTWTIPGGTFTPDGYVILRRNGSAVTDVPVDGVSYTNNQILPGSRIAVVSPGAVDTFLQSNLTACVDYHFAIFPYRVNSASGETINYMTNNPATATASTTCDEPTLQASNIVFSVIGTNTVTLNWENGNGSRRMVVVRGTNEVNQHPVDGQTYTANATFGSGSHLGSGNFIVYRNTGSTVTVVGLAPGVTYHFRVYEFNGTGGGSDYNTNTAVNNPRSTATAAFGLVYEGFDYGSFVNLSGQSGGTGWTNSWSTSGGLVETGSGDYPDFGAYPPDTPPPTRSAFIDLGNASEDGSGSRKARRNFPAMTSGRMYVALKMNNAHTMGNSDYMGVNLLNGTTVTGFFGKAFGVANQRLTVEYNGSVRTNQLDGSNSGYGLNGGVDYLVVAMIDFNNREFKARAYTQSQLAHANPDLEAAWSVEMNNVFIDRIDGIQIVASDNNQIFTFDSIRIGPSWEEVMWGLRPQHHELNGPVPTLVYIGTNYNASVYDQVVTNLSDAELKSVNNIDFAVRWDSPLGVFLTNAVATNRNIGSPNARVSPNWDPLAIGLATNQFNLDRFFTNYFGVNGATSVTTFQYRAFNITNINFENQYFVTVSAENNPGGGTVAAPNGGTWDAVPTNRAITINTPLRFYVYDDDTNVPVRGTGGMAVLTSAAPASAQAVGEVFRYFVTDGVLASNGMDVSLRAYDDYSGLQRSADGDPTTNMSITMPGFVTNNIAHFNSARSSANTLVPTATNTWSFSSTNFTWQRITDLWGGDGSGSAGQDFEVRATVPDADDDRVDDQAFLFDELFGYIRISDDDVDAPTNQNITYGGISVLNRSFYVGTNGFAIGSGDTTIRNTYDRRSGVGNNTIFAITDEEMASSGSRGLEFAFGVIDTGSGISRGASGSTNDVMSFSIGDILSGVVTGFNATLSSAANLPNVLQTNVWTFGNGELTATIITQLMHRTGSSATGSVPVVIRVPDADNDRFNDRATLAGTTVGFLQVLDDDVAGPTMSAVDVRESTGGDSILASSFETSQGWPVSSLSSGVIWTNTDPYGAWVGQGVTHTSLDPKQSGTRRLGFLTNAFAQSWLQLPPISNPGSLSIYAGRVGTGAGDPGLALERWDGASWVGYGTNLVTVPGYVPYSWNIDEPGSNLLFRIRRVDTAGVFRTQVYADDIAINSRPTWIGTNHMTNAQITINWTAAVDDYSGIEDYHIVPPAVGSIPPATTNDGIPVNAAFTTAVQSILGQQGVITGFIFAVDDDSDRPFDRAMGNVVNMIIRVDTNPPVAVQEAATVVDATIDDTTEIKVIWSNHVSAARAAGWRQSDSAPLSDWDTYIIRYHELDISSPTTTELTRSSAGWSNLLSNHLFTNMVLSNLNFDARYAISIMGRDEAGNIGPAVTVTGITTIFSVTQGFNRVDTDLEVQWIWNEERTYDVVYVDSLSMSDSFTNQWKYLTTITNAGWMTDTGNTALARVRPTTLNNTLRFYRVSRQGAWTTNNTLRRGSIEVYTTKPLNLYTGENWHSLFFIPDTATVSYVFNTNILPRGATMAESTRISWFSPTAGGTSNQNGAVTAMVWLASSGQWLWQIGGPLNSNADNKLVPLDQGFLIEIPGDSQTNQAPALSMMIIGLVPTQEVTQVIAGGSSASNRIHILSHNMPVRVPISSMGFRGSGFTGNNNGVLADEVRILSQGGNGSLQNPKARLRLRSDGTTWQYYNTPGPGASADPAQFIIEPDDAVIVIRRNAATMTWTNRLWYTPPNKNFNP